MVIEAAAIQMVALLPMRGLDMWSRRTVVHEAVVVAMAALCKQVVDFGPLTSKSPWEHLLGWMPLKRGVHSSCQARPKRDPSVHYAENPQVHSSCPAAVKLAPYGGPVQDVPGAPTSTWEAVKSRESR